jgi:TolA-binding protein
MDRKELICILVLCAVVGIAATARLSGMTSELVSGLPGRPNGSRGSAAAPGTAPEGAGRLIWPPQRQRYLPRGSDAGTLFEAGERLFVEGLYDAAIAAYSRFIERFGDQRAAEIARFRIGQCLTLAGRHADAARHYDAFLAECPDSALRPMALLWSGIHRAALDDEAAARDRFLEVIAKHPRTPFADGARQRLAALDAPEQTQPATHTPQPAPEP